MKDVKYCCYRQHNEMLPSSPQKFPNVTNPFHLKFSCFRHGCWSVGVLLLGLHAMWQTEVSEKCTASIFMVTILIVWVLIGL